ncbi:MAG: T9SS type A sorting domain-containing protein [Chitinophagaceae bacterium]|nr:T9SS type A sorting domain-containing protein [Chitinophagaceae bacterium]
MKIHYPRVAGVAFACLLAACFLPNLLWAQPGKDGARTVTAANTVLNTYTTLSANAAVGATTLTVASNALNGGAFSGNLANGDLIMIIQMQGATINSTNTASYGNVDNYGSSGRYEFACVSGVAGSNSITVAAPLVNGYSAAGRTQVIRVPRFTTLTVNNNTSIVPNAWNGSTGGVVVIETTGNVALTGNNSIINANSAGFRGGSYADNAGLFPGTTDFVTSDASRGAAKGEGIAGAAADYDGLGGRYGRGAPANGGGGGNRHNAGGGGGSNGNNGVAYTGLGNPAPGFNAAWDLEGGGFATSASSGGGRGGYTYGANNANATTQGPGNTAWGGDNRLNVGGFGGRPLDQLSGGRLFLGGGGGAGDGNNGTGSSGANGGGMVFLIVGGNVTGNGAINANGATAANTTGGHNDAPGGGGGGGTIVLYQRSAAGTIAANIDLNANGGAGGNQLITNDESEGPGGGGGGGYVAVRSTSSPVISVAGGANGTSTSTAVTEFTPNGATRGATGQSTTYTPQSSLFVVASGTVLRDGNGQLDATINGTGSNLSGQLYISAVQSGNVIQTVAVAANGSFSLNALPPGTYDYVLHTNAAGQTTTSLPAGFISTAEGTAATGDGTVNGITNGTANCAPLSTLLFGVNAVPVTNDYVGDGWPNPGGAARIPVPSGAFSATDPDDGSYTNNLNGRKVTLYPATGGVLYYNGVPVTAPLTINSFNNDLVEVDPDNGPVVVDFDYAVWDNADVIDPTPATVSMGIGGILLPATGLQLKASLQADGSILASWQTLTEQNTRHFTVQISSNGTVYEAVGQVAAAGNSNTARQYSLRLPARAAGQWQLRVMLTDADGKRSYSNVVSLRTQAVVRLTAVPNPASQQVLVSGLQQARSLKLVNAGGQVVASFAVNTPQMKVSLEAVPEGLYLIQVQMSDGTVQLLKVMKR